jgi:hypothetical protein
MEQAFILPGNLSAVHASLFYDPENPKQGSGNQHQYYG